MGVTMYHVSTQDAECMSHCMSESQGRSIRGFDRLDFTNEHVEVS